MAVFNRRDVRVALALIDDVYSADTPERFAAIGVEALARLVPGEIVAARDAVGVPRRTTATRADCAKPVEPLRGKIRSISARRALLSEASVLPGQDGCWALASTS